MRAEAASGNRQVVVAQPFNNEINERAGQIGMGCRNEAGAAALAGVGEQGKLADDQHTARYIQHRPIETALSVSEDAEFCRFLRQLSGVFRRIARGDPDEEQESVADLPDRHTVNRHRRLSDPLEHGAHGVLPTR